MFPEASATVKILSSKHAFGLATHLVIRYQGRKVHVECV